MKSTNKMTQSPRFGKVFLLSLWSTALRFLCQFGIGKISALYLGPSGMFLFGQIQNILAIGGSLSGGAIQTGITRYSAESHETFISKSLIISALILTISGGVLWGIGSFLYSANTFSILGISSIPPVFLYIFLIPFSLIISVISQTVTSLFQGKQQFSLWNASLTYYTFLNFLIICVGIYFFGKDGILPALLIVPIVRLAVSLQLWKKSGLEIKKRDKESSTLYLIPLAKYLLTGLSATALSPFILIIIRSAITSHASEHDAGLWQGVWRLSELGTSVLVALFGSWFVPKIAAATDNDQLRRLALTMSLRISGFVVPAVCLIWIFRNQCISLGLSNSFLPIASSIHWQLFGDLFRSFAWIFGTILMVRGHFRQFLLVEIGGQLLFLFLSLIFITNSGYHGVMKAYALESFLDMLLCIYLTLRVLR